jgi:sugar lactone lactonase YvrE
MKQKSGSRPKFSVSCRPRAGQAYCTAILLATVFVNKAGADALYMTEFYQGTVVKLDLSSGATSTIASGISNPEGLAADQAGNLYVATQTQGVIDRINPLGQVTTFISNPSGYYFSGLAFDSSGNLYVGANKYAGTFVSAILKYSPTGSLISTWSWPGGNGTPLQPTGLAFDKAGNLIVTDYSGNALYSISPNGTPTLLASVGVNPMGLTFDTQGNLFFANRSSGTIDERTPDGTISTFASGIDSPAGLAFDAGNLYAADSPNGGDGTTLTEIKPDGTTSIFATGLDEPLYLVVVPEPGTWALVSLAATLWILRRRVIRGNHKEKNFNT